jgi:hypothetical protein
LELLGERVPRPVLRRADGWWDVVPQSTAIRAPQVLLWLTKMSEQRRLSCCLLGWTGASATMTCACSTRTAASWPPAGSRIVWRGVGELHALVAGRADQPGQVAVGVETDRGLLVGALLAAGYQIYAVNPRSSAATAAAMATLEPSPIEGMPRCWPIWSAPTGTTPPGRR